MNHLVRICSNWMIVAFCMIISTNALARDWSKAESEHFVAFSNISDNQTRGYLRQLESFKFLTEMMLGASMQSAASSAKFTVYMLKDQEQLQIINPQLANSHYAGVYFHCSEGAADFSWMTRPFDSDGDDQALIVLQHEYAHHLMFSRLSRFMPRWYVEGFAEYLSTVTLQRGKFLVGSSATGRVYTLKDGRGWIDFHTLLDTKKYLALLRDKKVDEGHFYAQSWLLTHYMLSDSGRTKAFNKYFDAIGQGADPVSSFESTTGIAVEKLETILERHLSKLPVISVTVPDIPDSSITITKLDSAQSDYILESAALQTCPGETYGKELLEKLRGLRSKHSNESEFNLALIRAELLFGDVKSVQTQLEQIVASDPTNFTAHYLLGRSYYKAALAAPKPDNQLLGLAKQEFIGAYKLNRLNAANMYFLARAFNSESAGSVPSKNLLNAASGAAYLMPSVYEYATLSAEVNMRADNREQAIRALQPFACDPHNPKQAAGIARVIAALGAGQDFDKALRAFEEPSEPAAP